MAYFHSSTLKAPCIIWMLLTITATNPITFNGKGDLPALPIIKQFLQLYVQPFLRSLPIMNYPNLRATKVTYMDKFIKDKVAELKPFLQDDDAPIIKVDSDDKLTLEGEEETTIVEFPVEIKDKKNNLRNSNKTSESYKAIQRYKSLRNQIKTVLEKESVSRKTKKFVTNTLDDMIAHMIGNQCTWKSGTAAKYAKLNKFKRKSQNGYDPVAVAKAWNIQWQNLKREYLNTQGNEHKETDPFMQQFQHFVSNITNDLKLLSRDYKIECQLLSKNNNLSTQDNDEFEEIRGAMRSRVMPLRSKTISENFRLCSDELTDFIKDFYVNLNDTIVSTLRNYAAMYNRDIGDEDEKEITIKLILNTSKEVEDSIKGTFKRQTNKLKPDKTKNREANIKELTKYVQKTIKHVKKRVTKALIPNLEKLKARLMETIAKDLTVNLDVELGNLEKEICGRICTVFEICNGKYVARRQEDGKYIGDKDSVYVKVQLTLDNDLKDNISSNKTQSLRRIDPIKQSNTAYNRFTNPQIVFINVTRTTLFEPVALKLSTIISSPSMKLNETDFNFAGNDNSV